MHSDLVLREILQYLFMYGIERMNIYSSCSATADKSVCVETKEMFDGWWEEKKRVQLKSFNDGTFFKKVPDLREIRVQRGF